ncbi:MAG TPA: Holliday junction resolvase RuvX, partial [Fimbriiglobus sp.]|nr:Holliday junction resolvase RuvX [Fimbriiglobus sp.]
RPRLREQPFYHVAVDVGQPTAFVASAGFVPRSLATHRSPSGQRARNARRSADQDAAFFQNLAAAESAVGWVVGLPLMTLTGDEGTKAKECRAFGAWLYQITGLPVAYQDERYTSSAAEDALWGAGLTHKKRRSRRDRVAAQLILQAFLDAGGPTG